MRPQTVNHLCRRMAEDGELDRVGTRPILNRLAAPAKRRRRGKVGAPTVEAVPDAPAVEAATEPLAVETEPDASETEASPAAETEPAPAEAAAPPAAVGIASTTTRGSARPRRQRTQQQVPKVAEDASTTEASPAAETATEHDVTPRRPDGPTCVPPPYDALQAWSRVVNVQALVASWLVRRGATLRWVAVDGDGPARDLVASMDGDDLHVEVTGWPADGARTHPTTIAGDWFSAAEQAAAQRRRAHPRARIVIALPDTRRYRSLTAQRSASLAGTEAEVWFVDPAGAVHAR